MVAAIGDVAVMFGMKLGRNKFRTFCDEFRDPRHCDCFAKHRWCV